ncbi:uncharacterized protein BO66DRAFT_394000 [Aspergillus aculeatinus CBS 121060]|uniref:Uncharacterized protein n=1 Tax=Aspergillus aculeatinus CBS 121060 TaxID=1448322 RepID=A0ACD1H0T4_9EURO|nr:hypothetical protein BO66DRAFT_394000 [Aspergillus aculeatinus CBS 121060]RAH67200.1 hypothetical protein BO66DRAFT_394000 [Aspergillus aculeatinus CBS 121060]
MPDHRLLAVLHDSLAVATSRFPIDGPSFAAAALPGGDFEIVSSHIGGERVFFYRLSPALKTGQHMGPHCLRTVGHSFVAVAAYDSAVFDMSNQTFVVVVGAGRDPRGGAH